MATPKRQTKKKAKSRTPVYFLSLTVENVRCFGPKQTLQLSDGNGRPQQWTIILGNNGVGKTTLLQILASLSPKERSFIDEDGNEKFVLDRRISLEWNPIMSNKSDSFFGANLFVGAKLKDESRGKEVEGIHLRKNPGYFSGGPIIEEFGEMICFGYGASRRMSQTSLSESDEDSTASLFSDDVTLLNAEEWFLQTDYTARIDSPIQNRAVERRKQVQEVLINLLPDVSDIRIARLSKKNPKPRVELQTPYGWVSIKDLSLGYRTLIAWMVDFASRMFDIYSDSLNPLAEPAVVLVDEIDLHLHPRWQRTLMRYLSERFPNTQFIATAHSPLVVQSATDANIVLLRREGDHVVIDNDPQTIKGWRVDQILTSELFGLESARPPQYEKDIADRRKLLAKAKLTNKDKERLREIEERIGELPTGETHQDIEAMDIIRRAAEELKKQNKWSFNDSHKETEESSISSGKRRKS
jgi:predicted ATP-binding protein involved in virulence